MLNGWRSQLNKILSLIALANDRATLKYQFEISSEQSVNYHNIITGYKCILLFPGRHMHENNSNSILNSIILRLDNSMINEITGLLRRYDELLRNNYNNNILKMTN